MEQRKAVGIWVRVSTEDQAKGESPEHHEKRARLYAESKGWEIITVYHLEALSGKSVMGYGETARMLADIKKGAITGLIFSKLARLARNTKELLEFADIFQKDGADLISLQEAIDTSTPAGRLFYTMIAAMAQWEREEIASRVAASIPIRAQLGKNLGGIAPLGYKWEGKNFVLDEEFAPLRKLVYDLYLKYRRKKAVAKHLNEAGYRTRANKLFSDTTIKQLIQDTTAKGMRRVNYSSKGPDRKNYHLKPVDEWSTFPCPAIVSVEQWNECNRILDEGLLKNKKPGPRPKHLLAGYVTCDDCNEKMYVLHKSDIPLYRCRKCGNRIPAADMEEIYHIQLKSFLLTDVSVAEYERKVDDELQSKRKLLERITDNREAIAKKLDSLISLRVENDISKEIFADRYKPLEEQLTQLNNQLPELEAEVAFLDIQYKSSQVVLDDAKNLYDRWNDLDLEDKRHIVETITDCIAIGREDIRIKLSYLPSTKPTQTAGPTHNTNTQQNGGKRQSDQCGPSCPG